MVAGSEEKAQSIRGFEPAGEVEAPLECVVKGELLFGRGQGGQGGSTSLVPRLGIHPRLSPELGEEGCYVLDFKSTLPLTPSLPSVEVNTTMSSLSGSKRHGLWSKNKIPGNPWV